MRNKIILVVGSGRSGTSLTMQILEAWGIDVLGNFLEPQYENVKGFYETKELLTFNKNCLEKLSGNTLYGDAFRLRARDYKEETDLLKKTIPVGKGNIPNVALKDPRISTLLPIYRRAFSGSELKIILTVRNPSSFILSQSKVSSQTKKAFELLWLIRNVQVVEETGGYFFLLQFEDLMTDQSPEILKQLNEYLAIGQNSNHYISKAMEVVDRSLNRSSYNPDCELGAVTKLYYSLLCRSKGVKERGQDLIHVTRWLSNELHLRFDNDIEKFAQNMEDIMAADLDKEKSDEINEILGLQSAVDQDEYQSTKDELLELKKQNNFFKSELNEVVLKLNETAKEAKQLHSECEDLRRQNANLNEKLKNIQEHPSKNKMAALPISKPVKKSKPQNPNYQGSNESNKRSKLKKAKEYITIFMSGEFDAKWYLMEYPDVKENRMPALLHYVLYGAAEGREPNQNFNTVRYKMANPNYKQSKESALYHKVKNSGS